MEVFLNLPDFTDFFQIETLQNFIFIFFKEFFLTHCIT